MKMEQESTVCHIRTGQVYRVKRQHVKRYTTKFNFYCYAWLTFHFYVFIEELRYIGATFPSTMLLINLVEWSNLLSNMLEQFIDCILIWIWLFTQQWKLCLLTLWKT